MFSEIAKGLRPPGVEKRPRSPPGFAKESRSTSVPNVNPYAAEESTSKLKRYSPVSVAVNIPVIIIPKFVTGTNWPYISATMDSFESVW